MRGHCWIGLFGLLLLGACGDPFTQPACYNGPGCGEDHVPPVAEIIAPSDGDTVDCPFWLEVTATDNIGILGAEFFLMGFPLNTALLTDPPYRMVIDPTFVQPVPGMTPGPRDLEVRVHDVADNVDTLYMTVIYKQPTRVCPSRFSERPAE